MAKDWGIPRLLDVYGSLLTEKQRAITAHYYDDDLSLAEIAENEGVTRQAVRDVIKRTEEQLLQWEDKLHLAARAEDVTALRKAAMCDDRSLRQQVLAFCDKQERTESKEEQHGV